MTITIFIYVKVQFYPWFKFYFPLFQACYHYTCTLHYLEGIWFIITKDRIEPCEVFIPGGQGQFVQNVWQYLKSQNKLKE